MTADSRRGQSANHHFMLNVKAIASTNLDPLLKNLRSDPRYPAFLKKHNLPN